MQEKVTRTACCNSVGRANKPKVSDGLRIGWVYNPNLPAVLLLYTFHYSTARRNNASDYF